MAFKLTKEEKKNRDEHVKSIDSKRDDLQGAINAYNEKMEEVKAELQEAIDVYNDKMNEAKAKVEEALSDYNSALGDAKSFADDVANQGNSDFDDKSERWQEGEAAEAAREWIDAWENAELDEVEFDFPEEVSIDLPEELDADVENHHETLENLPEEKA